MRRPSSPSVPRTFRMDGSNLPLVVREFRKHHEGDFKDWLEHLRTVLPDLEMIDVIELPGECHLYGQVLLATHSPLIVGLTKREPILCFAKNPSSATSIGCGNEHPKLKNWRGLVDLEMLYAAGVVG